MKIKLGLLTFLFISSFNHAEAQETSILEQFLPEWRLLHDFALFALTPTSKNPRNLRLAKELHKLQPTVKDDVPFPCPLNNTRSAKRPESVHALRPGDIDVIGAFGDSVVTGNGLVATNLLHVFLENRGVSFTIGGQGTWRQYLTLPNILKEFNPRLIGYSLQDSSSHNKESQFNVAEPGALSRDVSYTAKVLIKRMENDPRVNITRDWKMVSYMTGSNDFCTILCSRKNPEAAVQEHRDDLVKMLRVFRDNLPRTIVNIIVAFNLKTFQNVTLSNRPPLCYLTHNIICSCLFGLQYQHLQDRFKQIMSKWQQVDIDVVNDPEFDREDFAAIAQPFSLHYTLHNTEEGLTDYSDLSADCLHLSQKQGARAALSLWNNLLEPVGSKTTHAFELFNFKCPNHDHPFIFTRRNSLSTNRYRNV